MSGALALQPHSVAACSGMPRTPVVTIDGRRLSEAECETVRMALQHFLAELDAQEAAETATETEAKATTAQARAIMQAWGAPASKP